MFAVAGLFLLVVSTNTSCESRECHLLCNTQLGLIGSSSLRAETGSGGTEGKYWGFKVKGSLPPVLITALVRMHMPLWQLKQGFSVCLPSA